MEGPGESPPPLDISPEPPALPLDGPTVAAPGSGEGDSPPPLDCGHAADDDVKPPSPSPTLSLGAAAPEAEGDAQRQHQQHQGFVPYGPQAGRDLVDQQSSGYHVRPHEKPPPLLQATLGLATAYLRVRERRGKVRPRGGWAGTATGETRLFTSDDGSLRLGPHLPLLLGRYRFLRLVGQGTFAQIICAEDTLHPARRQVAVKILNFHYGEVGKREALCLRVAHEAIEADGGAGGGAGHAAIVRLLGAFDFMGHFCLVLELCQGGSLQAFVRPLAPPPPPPAAAAAASPLAAIAAVASVPTRKEAPGPADGEGGLPLPQLREVALHLVKALLLLHNHDVIHADLKPENVLLLAPPPRGRSGSISGSTGSGSSGSGGSPGSSSYSYTSVGSGGGGSWLGASVRLTDLGNAIKSREVKLYKEDYEIQTLSYRAPEVLVGGCGGQAFDHRIDMWSLGVLLVELHLGRPLFRAASKTLMVKRILSVLGPLPAAPFATGKFYATLFGPDHRLRPEALALRDDPAHAATALVDPATVQNSFRYDPGAHHRLVCDLLRTRDRGLIGFVAGLLQLDPAARLTSLQALMHPFLTPCFPFSLLRPHLAPAVLEGLCEQQRRQQQGDARGAKPAIRPGRLFALPAAVEEEAATAVAVQQQRQQEGLKREAPAAKATGSGSDGSKSALVAVLEMPDSDGPQPSPASTPALSLGPESPPRASEGEEDDDEAEGEGAEAESPRLEQDQGQQQEGQGGRKASRKRTREGRPPRDRPPAPPAAASSPAKPLAKPSPAKPAPSSSSAKAAGARKWWEAGDEEEEEEGAGRSVRQRPFAEEKAGGREEGPRRRQAAAGAGAVVKRSSLEAAAAEEGDEISEDELIL